jgi:hypothetical protein
MGERRVISSPGKANFHSGHWFAAGKRNAERQKNRRRHAVFGYAYRYPAISPPKST